MRVKKIKVFLIWVESVVFESMMGFSDDMFH
jgi:hypothetical protein